MNHVVFVPLDRASRRSCRALLSHGGFSVELCTTLARALWAVRKRPPSAVIVAVDGAESPAAVTTIRRGTDAPILVISPPTSESDKVHALDAGADDYLTQPYGVDELLARVRALLRRSGENGADRHVTTSDFTIEIDARRLRVVDGTERTLTAMEWRVLEVLLRRPGHLVSREELLREVWGPKGLEQPHNLRVYVSRLRQKLEPDPHNPRYVMTAFGLGLYFRTDETAGREMAKHAVARA